MRHGRDPELNCDYDESKDLECYCLLDSCQVNEVDSDTGKCCQPPRRSRD